MHQDVLLSDIDHISQQLSCTWCSNVSVIRPKKAQGKLTEMSLMSSLRNHLI